MSLEELKRVTEAHNGTSYRYLCSFSALKSELNNVREKHQGESQTKENLIAELRKKIQDMEEEAAQQPDLSKKLENLVSKLKEFEEATGHETALKTEIEELRQRAEETEVRASKVKDFRNQLIV
jgi:septal ring factor EnvC (AmiA/AmiB activator)